MKSENHFDSEHAWHSLDATEKIPKVVGDAVILRSRESPIQVAAAPDGMVLISGITPSMEAAVGAGKVSEAVTSVKRLLNSLTNA